MALKDGVYLKRSIMHNVLSELVLESFPGRHSLISGSEQSCYFEDYERLEKSYTFIVFPLVVHVTEKVV